MILAAHSPRRMTSLSSAQTPIQGSASSTVRLYEDKVAEGTILDDAKQR